MATERAALAALYRSYPIPATHAECVELSRRKARDRERLADEAGLDGDHEAAAEHRRVAKLYREEADLQAPEPRTGDTADMVERTIAHRQV